MDDTEVRIQSTKTVLHCYVGGVLFGGDGAPSYTVRAVAILATRRCLPFESWARIHELFERKGAVALGRREIWQLERDDGADVWLEVDHASREPMLLEPVETSRPVATPAELGPGAPTDIAWDGSAHRLSGTEHGFARAIAVKGRFAAPLRTGDIVEYADLESPPGPVVRVRRSTSRLGTTTMVFAGRVLDVPEQHRLFGRGLVRGSEFRGESPRSQTAFDRWFYRRFIPVSAVILIQLFVWWLKSR